MQPSPFSRMLWKETREHLPLATAIILGSTLLQFLWISILHNAPTSEYSQALTLIPAALAAAFALCAGSLMFANERESETLDFLRRLPTNPAFIFRVKFCAGILSTFALVALLTPIALLLVYWKGSLSDLGISESSAEHLTSVLVIAHLFIWGMFFSLLTGKVLRSLFLGIIATMIARQAYPYDSLILVLGLIVCYMMKTRWFYETPRSSRRIFPAISIQVELPTVQISLPSFLDAKASPSTRALGRLLWLELNRAKNLLLLAPFYVIAIPFIYQQNAPWGILDQLAQGFPFGTTACAIGLLPFFFFAGLASYSSDQLRQQFRFLGERGVTPRHVYRSKFIIWFLLCSFLPMFLLLVASSPMFYRFNSDDETRTLIVVLFTALILCYTIGLTAYSIGQLASLLVQSRILAASLALFLAILVAGWINSLYQYRYGPEIIAPQVILFPLIFLVAARLRVRNWLRERNSLGSWLKYHTLALFLPLSICFASVPLYRAYSIPQVQPLEYSLTPRKLDFPDPATRLFAIRTAIEIRCMGDTGSPDVHLSELFTSSRPTDGYNPYGLWYAPLSPSESGWQHATISEKNWVAQHRTWLNNSTVIDAQAAELRSHPYYQSSKINLILRDPYQLLRLAYLHHLEGSRLASEGDLNAALQHHLHALRLAGLRWKLDQNIAYQDLQTRFKPFWESELLTAWSIRWLQSWTLHPSQTHESLAAAIPHLEQSLNDLATPSQSGQLLAQTFEKNVTTAEFGSPWENERHRRLALIIARREVNNGFSADRRLVKGRESDHTKIVDWQQVNNQPTDNQSIAERHQLQKIINTRLQSADHQFHHELSSWTNRSRNLYRWRIIAFQALELSMALNAWRIEHGSFPSTLQPLVGPYFDEIPRFNLGPLSTERSRLPFTYLPEGLDGNLHLLSRFTQPLNQQEVFASLPAKTPFIMFSDRGFPAFIPHPTKDGHAFNIDPSNQWQFHPTSPHLLFGYCDFILLPLIPTELLKSVQASNGTARAFLPTPPRPATTRPTDTNTPD